MKILLVGSGGREHALALKLSQSPLCETLYCAPGNAGIEACATCIPINAEDIEGILKFVKEKSVDFVIVGPEAPLVSGLADRLRALEIPVFGCSKAAAQLEGSKGFMKDLCARHDIPTAKYGRFTDLGDAIVFIQSMRTPVVVKTDGLAAGKGVIIAQTHEEAIYAAEGMLSGESFGDAGTEIVVEEFLDGEELSYFALADGKTILPLTSAQDHKRAYDNDEGPNTGGMGTYSPAHMMTPALEEKIITRLIKPTIDGMAADGCPFTGVLFAGVMVVQGEPVLLEHNIRFGDPECQSIMARLEGDLVKILYACAKGELESVQNEISWSPQPAICVVMASKGYPGSYTKDSVIKGLDEAAAVKNVTILHAGTDRNARGDVINTGGRVLGITAVGADIKHARDSAYEAVDRIDWPEGFCRRDIGWRAMKS